MRRLWLVPLAALALSTPALATDRERDERAREIQRELSNPAVVGGLSAVMAAMVDAIMDVRIGKLAAVLDGDTRPSRAESDRTVADVAGKDDPYFRERTREKVAAASAGMGGVARAMAAAIPDLLRATDTIEEEVERVARTLPGGVARGRDLDERERRDERDRERSDDRD